MDAFEKAKIALHKYITENPEKVAQDLENMRKKSKGYDIYKYLENVVKELKN